MIAHKVLIVNEKNGEEKVLWQSEYEEFDFARLYYEQQRQQMDLKSAADGIVGVFEFNGFSWFYSLEKELVMPSGETLFFNFYEPNQIELAYFKHHSEPYLTQKKNKKVV